MCILLPNCNFMIGKLPPRCPEQFEKQTNFLGQISQNNAKNNKFGIFVNTYLRNQVRLIY